MSAPPFDPASFVVRKRIRPITLWMPGSKIRFFEPAVAIAGTILAALLGALAGGVLAAVLLGRVHPAVPGQGAADRRGGVPLRSEEYREMNLKEYLL